MHHHDYHELNHNYQYQHHHKLTLPQLSFTKWPLLSNANVPETDCQNSRNNFADLSKLLEQLCKLVQNYQPGSSSLRMAISIVFFGPIFKLVLSISGSRLTCIIIVVVIHTYPDMYKVTSQNHRLRQFLGGSIPLSVRHKHNSCLLFAPVGSSGHQRTQWI